MFDRAPSSPWVDRAHAALILVAFAAFASENLVHYPVALMALVGLARCLRQPALLRQPGVATISVLFLCIWLPMALACIDAVAPERSFETTALYLHFLPAAWYLVLVGGRPYVRHVVTGGIVVLVMFMAFDAFAQLIWGRDMFGYPYENNLLTGLFHPKQRIGLFLAVLAPLTIDVLRRWSHVFPALWIVLLPLSTVLLMSLKRSAWVMFSAGVAGYVWVSQRNGRGLTAGHVVKIGAALVLVTALMVTFNPVLRQQAATTAGLFSGDLETMDRATSYRLSLWRTGGNIVAAHWVNGIGPRGFRHAYSTYAPSDDFWLARGATGQTHPHWLLLEVAVECGLLGLLGLVAFYVVLLRGLGGRGEAVDATGRLYLLCALVAWFPLNAHLAFYGSYWATLAWLLLGLGLAREPERTGAEERRAVP